MNFEQFIYKRYLFSKKKFQFISLINKLSILGIAIGVASLIIVLSIFNGFKDFTINELVRDNPHIIIENYSEKIIEYVNNDNSNIYNYFEVYENEILVEHNKNKINTKLIISDRFESNVISNHLVKSLDIFLGDTIKFTSLTQIETLITSFRLVKPKKIVVDNISYDNSNFIKSNDLSLIVDGKKKLLYVFLNDYNNAEKYSSKLKEKFKDIEISTWYSKNKLLLLIMNVERNFVFVVLFIIIIIASFNLFASISMTIFEKQKDIGILRTLGANSKSIFKIFLTQGSISGFLGLFVGVLIGLGIVLSQINYQFLRISVNNGFSHPLPMKLDILDIVITSIATVILILLSTYFPAKLSTKKDITQNIKLNF